MKVWNFLAARRKAIVAFVIGALNVLLIYLTLIADGVLSNADQQSLVIAVIAWLGGTVLVHQATNTNTTSVN